MVIFYRIRVCEQIAKICASIRNCNSDCTKTNELQRILKPSGFNTNIMVYNSSVKRKTELITKENGIISWYCCGPTVYDSAHIGHACCYVRFDIIRRIIEDIFFKNVILVMGITDIDDKIINRANQESVDFRTVSQFYEKEFFKDMNRFNIKKPSLTARVSDYIPEIINFIKIIVDNGYGYVTSDGTVNFPVDKYQGYGVLVGAQEEFNDGTLDKKSSRDFAMWKGAKPGEPSWSSPWGEGRPGWHIECSTIASKLLGNRLDIHSGGIDLKFPHHENEEAQCCVHHNVNSWVRCWMHSGHVQLGDSVKMSKSLKNTISIDHFLSKYTSDHLRMLCLMIPYRKDIEYGDNVMEGAIAVYKKLKNFINDCNAYIRGYKSLGDFEESTIFQDLNDTREDVLKCLADDFDTNGALSRIIQFTVKSNSAFTNKTNNIGAGSYFAVAAAGSYVENFMSICGFCLSDAEIESSDYYDFSSIMDISLKLRSKVRNIALSKNGKLEDSKGVKGSLLSACDEFRNNMHCSGIELKDHGLTTSWTFRDKMRNPRENDK